MFMILIVIIITPFLLITIPTYDYHYKHCLGPVWPCFQACVELAYSYDSSLDLLSWMRQHIWLHRTGALDIPLKWQI